jgi:hypothetical protein
MNAETWSFTVRLLRDRHTNTARLQVMRVDQAREVPLTNNTFLLRVTIDKGGAVERCFVRHVASGREAYVQGGPGLGAFVKECLLEGAEPAQPDETGG